MNAAFDPHAVKHSFVYAKSEFFCVESCIGYRSVSGGNIIAFLPGETSDAELGAGVLQALSSYRVLATTEIANFREVANAEARNLVWERQLMAQAGYRSRQELYRGLRHVPVRLRNSELIVSATAKDRRHGFEGNGFSLTIDVNVGAEGIGAAIKKVVAECA